MLVTGRILGLYYTGTDNIVYSRCQFFVISSYVEIKMTMAVIVSFKLKRLAKSKPSS